MAQKQKYTKSAVANLFNHYDRSKFIEHISPEKTQLNYNLAASDQPLGQMEFLNKRLSEIKVHNRKDINVMVDWVVTLPKNIQNLSDEEKFFSESYKFLKNRYGIENVISCYVHKDETTPHMHYSFVPVAFDLKKQIYKLSAKEVITRLDLQKFHLDLSNHMFNVFGRDIGVLNGATKNGNKTILELKCKSLEENLKLTQQSLIEARKKEKAINIIYDVKKTYVEALNENYEDLKMYPKYTKLKKSFLGKEFVIVPREKWEEKHLIYSQQNYLRKATQKLNNNLDFLNDCIEEINNLKLEVDKLKQENYKKEFHLKIKENELKDIEFNIKLLINKLPKEFRDAFLVNLNKSKNYEKSK